MAKKTLKKQFIKGYVKTSDDSDGTLQVSIASTNDVDRDGDTIQADGWVLTNFKKNPVLLWGHNPFSPAIGIVDKIKKTKDGLIFVPKFDLDDDFAKLLFGKYQKGILNTFSVGFDPIDWEETDKGFNFTKQELLEVSAVNIPANPKAEVVREMSDVYAMAKSKGYKLDEEAEKIINKYIKNKPKKETTNEKVDKLTKQVEELATVVKNLTTPTDTKSVQQGDKGDDNLDKSEAVLTNGDKEILRNNLVLQYKIIQQTLRKLKK